MAESTDRAWLLRLVRAVRDQLDRSVSDPLLKLRPTGGLSLSDSDTAGWYVTVGAVEGVRAELQIWLDHYAAESRRSLSSALTSKTNPQLIQDIASAGTGALAPAATLGNTDYERVNGVARLRSGLPAALYRRPIAELYEGSWQYYSMYWPDDIRRERKPHPDIVAGVVQFLAAVVRAASGIAFATPQRPYPGQKNRAKVEEHLRRDRSGSLGLQAKIRDGFTCQVCGIYFAQLYGTLGRGFAEVHHRVPLASLKASTHTVLADLLTVCANCHRMLHRMVGKADDVEALKKKFTRRWPGSSRATAGASDALPHQRRMRRGKK